jgi:hypothetical protein
MYAGNSWRVLVDDRYSFNENALRFDPSLEQVYMWTSWLVCEKFMVLAYWWPLIHSMKMLFDLTFPRTGVYVQKTFVWKQSVQVLYMCAHGCMHAYYDCVYMYLQQSMCVCVSVNTYTCSKHADECSDTSVLHAQILIVTLRTRTYFYIYNIDSMPHALWQETFRYASAD